MSRSTHIKVEIGQDVEVELAFWTRTLAEQLGMALHEERVLYGADARAVLITAIAAEQGNAAMLGLLLEQSNHTGEFVRVAVTYLD